MSCSALKQRYRDVLLQGHADVGLVYLKGSYALIGSRVSRRRSHFMPPALLKSQFDALEEPTAEENALVISVRMTPKRIVEAIVAHFMLAPVRRVLA